MEKIFDCLIDSFINDKVGIANNFLGADLATQLHNNLDQLFSDKLLCAAGTGNQALVVQNTLVRGDQIYWLDRKHDNTFENAFFDLMDQFVVYLNRTCYTGITGYEFHYTRYETGSFYTRHLDQFKNNGSRQYSMIMYLNEGWTIADGGQLCMHHTNSVQCIAPTNGKSVFFKSSEIEHEVMLTNKPRLSITGWLKVN